MSSKVASSKYSPGSDSPSRLEDLFQATESDSDSFSFPDSTIVQESEPEKTDRSQEILARMEAEKAFSKLYRTGSDGKLLQVVRRRDFQPLSANEMQRIRLQESQVASSPLVQENAGLQHFEEAQERFRYPYWSFIPKRKNFTSTFKKRPPQKLLTRSETQPLHSSKTPLIPVDSHVAKPLIITSQVKVKKKIPSTEKLRDTGRDLGFDTFEEQYTERFKQFSSAFNEGRGSNISGISRFSGAKTARPRMHTQLPTIKKGLTHRESIDNHSSVKVFDPEEFRRERMLAEQAKALFMSGAFSKFYNKEREDSDKEMMAWIKYC